MALLAVAQISISDAEVEKAFLDVLVSYGLDPGEVYDPENEEGIDMISVKVLTNYLDADISEGGYSISYKDSIEKKISRLKVKWGVGVIIDPGVQDVSYLW